MERVYVGADREEAWEERQGSAVSCGWSIPFLYLILVAAGGVFLYLILISFLETGIVVIK